MQLKLIPENVKSLLKEGKKSKVAASHPLLKFIYDQSYGDVDQSTEKSLCSIVEILKLLFYCLG